jgi:hypothetical protein
MHKGFTGRTVLQVARNPGIDVRPGEEKDYPGRHRILNHRGRNEHLDLGKYVRIRLMGF